MSKYTIDRCVDLNGKETDLFEIYQYGFGYRIIPEVYYKANGKVEQINIIDMMYRKCIKECYQIRSANTFINKLFKSLTKKASA